MPFTAPHSQLPCCNGDLFKVGGCRWFPCMSGYYNPQSPASWQQNRPGDWDPRSTSSTPGHASSYSKDMQGPPTDMMTRFTAQMKPEDPSAFNSQIDEVDRAVDNLIKSGKMFNPPRRDSMPMMAAPVPFGRELHQRPIDVGMIGMSNRQIHASPMAEPYMAERPTSVNLQNYYANQRFQQARPPMPQQHSQPSEPETMLQKNRRIAAQRERELRNYHQEQQLNRSLSSSVPNISRDQAYRGPLANNLLADLNTTLGKDARVMSPGAMSGDDRRELIARQRYALYNTHSEGAHSEDGNHHDDSRALTMNSNGASAPASNAGGTRVHTPATEHANGAQSAGAVSPNHARTSSGIQGFNRTSASSPGGSPPRSQRGSVAPGASSVAPIGTRPTSQAQQHQNPALLNKRSSPPLASPLAYGAFSVNQDSSEDPFDSIAKRSTSAASTEQHSSNNQADGLGWSKVWGPGSKGLNNVASVWG
ncbi:Similar to hypothetical protein [Tuber melanosporum Mel28]; acc. no. XP_002835337 [Pyronema omphalodes CBS 100304]|uniref:Uncharacterized protein n=1 Tax=Pyronema omphalodes (strain CBS 100304) TaxID=1076935 RepID=U4LSN1_PYROM|nr:Similar to hypothetical protein [Tuber melanosporum Mel28]; acc. no. XP_002835337 [Pyronema omphalodes CBS 100304]